MPCHYPHYGGYDHFSEWNNGIGVMKYPHNDGDYVQNDCGYEHHRRVDSFNPIMAKYVLWGKYLKILVSSGSTKLTCGDVKLMKIHTQ